MDNISRPTWAEIDLKALKYNVGEIKKMLSPGVKFMAVVKADGYGHGAYETGKAAVEAGVDYLGVATLEEALELRYKGLQFPVLILSEIPPKLSPQIVSWDLSQTIYTFELAERLSQAALSVGKSARVHVKIDTGMGRIGVSAEEAPSLIERISKLKGLNIEGIFTHFAQAEEHKGDFTNRQLIEFERIFQGLYHKGIKIPIRHAANSAAAFLHAKTHLNMVRIGLGFYGLHPSPTTKNRLKLRPVLAFKTKVVYIKKVPAGTPLSYGSTHVTGEATRIATLPVGYADGLSRSLSNRGQVLIHGKRFPIVGRICMDLTLVDIGSDSKIKVGDEVVIIGRQKEEQITAEELAEIEGTISYEVVCGIGKRVPRVYI